MIRGSSHLYPSNRDSRTRDAVLHRVFVLVSAAIAAVAVVVVLVPIVMLLPQAASEATSATVQGSQPLLQKVCDPIRRSMEQYKGGKQSVKDAA